MSDEPRLESVGFWQNDWDVATKALPDPRELVDASWPLRERIRVANYLKRGRPLVAYMGYSTCRFECGTPWHFMGKWDFGNRRYVWPEGYAHYVEFHAVRPPAQFLEHIRPALSWLWPWWRVGVWWRRLRFRWRIRLAAWDERRQEAKKRETPLHTAANDCDVDEVRRLLDEGANPNLADEYRLTPLARAQRFDVARVLIEAGAEIDPQPPGYITPLQQAASAGDVEWCRYLLDRGADVEAVDSCDRTPIERAKNDSVVQVLIEAGADATRGSPLYWPAHGGDLDRIERLLAAGAAVDGLVKDVTPLMGAAQSALGDEAVALLIAAGADVNARTELGETALIRAASRNSLPTIERLLAAGASSTALTKRGIGALHMAALGNRGREGSTKVIARLLEARAGPIDARDQWGRTALWIAVQYGGAPDAQVLLKAGADASIPDKEGVTAAVVAEQREMHELAAALRAAMGERASDD